MANACYHCGKKAIFGRSHTHHRGVAGGRWKKRAQKTRRIFRVNLLKVTIVENKQEKRVKLCSKCLKRIKKDLREGKRPFLTVKHFQSQFLLTAKKETNLKLSSASLPAN
ncbi:MAG: hypothetical protein NZL96_02240 [Patescibacteria group bacterium]|nr:hypothetical protein [Patescibacteria group bacterium]